MEYRNGEIWRMWELRRGWLSQPRRAEKRASNDYLMLRSTPKSEGWLSVMAHRVIWAYFHGAPDASLVINHKNGKKDDNRIENLELVTDSENILHAFRAGLVVPSQGEDHFRCKLTNDDVRRIRELWSTNQYLQREIAAMFDVRPNQISRIVNGKRRAAQECYE